MRTRKLLALLLAALALSGCPEPTEEEDEDGGEGTPPADNCNSKEDATSLAACQLTLGTAVEDYIGTPGDQDWYSFTMPATANPRTLVHITAGYGVPNTAVNLTVNVLRENGTTSLARKIDQHGQAAPKPVDIVFTFGEPNAKLFILLSDEAANPTRPNYDVRNPYQLKVEVFDNPDVNEPNDVNPTAITLAASGGIQQGQGQGYLATNDDVDKFSVAVPSGNNLLYVNLTGPRLTPAPQYRISYKIETSTGTIVAEGRVLNEFVDINLATARKITAGTYIITVTGYRAPNVTQPIPGDTRLQYTLAVKAMSDQDANEPNDTAATATNVSFSAPGQRSVTGRIAFVPDSDWYRLQLPANSSPTSLHWKVTEGTAGARFAPLPGDVDRQVRLFKDVSSASLCKDDYGTCPKNYEGNPLHQAMVEGYCTSASRCLLSARQEAVRLPNLGNFEGVLQIPPHSTTYELLFLYEDEQNDWANDKDYSVSFDWQNDADEAGRFSGSTEQVSSVAIAVDSAAASFPVPPSGATVLQGTINGGFGRLYQSDPNVGTGVRGPEDYEAIPTDVDLYELNLPAVGAPEDRTWELQWEVDKVNGALPGNIVLDMRFCQEGQTCNALGTAPSSAQSLGYVGGNLASWHGQSGLQPVYDRVDGTGTVTVTARAYGCYCIERTTMRAGKFFMRVVGVDRNNYAPITYRVKTALTDYPKQYAGVMTEGTLTCPAPMLTDAGSGLPMVWQNGCNFF